MDDTVLIVGAGLAGARCAETLRAGGYDRRVVLVGEEQRPPYDRPALSKELLAGTKTADRPPSRRSLAGAERRAPARDADRASRCPLAHRPSRATGASCRGAASLRCELRPGRRLAVVGAGFIGGEVATSASSLGVEVVVVEAAQVPLERVLGRDAGLLIAERYREQGVDLRLGVGLAGFRRGPGGRVRGLLLAGGAEIACDVAVLGIGAEPVAPIGATAGSGGIPTDACGRTALPGVYACGDVASTFRPSLGRRIRVEHWTSASAQGVAVAGAILGREEPHDDPPFFWSDQLGLRLQYVGHAEGWTAVEIDGDIDSFTVRYLGQDGSLAAALLANRPRQAATLRRELAA